MVLGELMEWSTQVFLPYGELGLFLVAFIESSFFPIPPDLLLIPLTLINPSSAILYASIATVGSVLGSILGYYIGLKGGRPILEKFASKSRIDKVEKYFEQYGDMAIGVAAFTPIPYKIFTIAAGTFKHSLTKLLIVSVIGRGARFFIEVFVILAFGEQIIFYLENYFGLLTLGVGAVAVGIYWIYKKRK